MCSSHSQVALRRYELTLMRVAYKLSMKDMDMWLKETREAIERNMGHGAFEKLSSFQTAAGMLRRAAEASHFSMKFEDFPALPGSPIRSFRIGILQMDNFWREVERIFAHNGVESALPSGVADKDLKPPREMMEVHDSWLFHQMYKNGSTRPHGAMALPLGLWTDEVAMTKTDRKIRVVVIRILNIWRENMEKIAMKIIIGALPDLGAAAKSKTEKGYAKAVMYNHVMKYILDPIFKIERLAAEPPVLNIGGHRVPVWLYFHEISADLKEQHEIFGTYMALNTPTNRPIPSHDIKVYACSAVLKW